MGKECTYIKWIMDEIKHICITYKERSTGTDAVKCSMSYMSKQLSLWADTVDKQPFTVHPHAFIGSIGLEAFFDVCGVLAFFAAYLFSIKALTALSSTFFLVSTLLFVFEYLLYLRCSDFLYPKKNTFNVFAVRKAKIESRKKIIFCGHADTAYEFPALLKYKMWVIYLYIILATVGKISFFVVGLVCLFSEVSQTAMLVLSLLELLSLLISIPFFFFVDWKTITDGANDNLTGCYIGMSILKEMSELDERLDYTDVCCLITDGEESGLRGASAFAKANRRKLNADNAIVIAIDTIHDPKELMIYHRGINFTQKNDSEVCSLLQRAGLSCGVDIPYTDFYPGATDAEAFSREGIKAAGLCAVKHTPSTYYHTRYDSWDNLNREGIEITRRVLKATANIYDKADAQF